jgi:hypothetical protein
MTFTEEQIAEAIAKAEQAVEMISSREVNP